MANGRGAGRRGRVDTSREGGRFVAIPAVVLESPAYLALSHPARSLLLEMALQCKGDDNGRLLCSDAYLSTRGWKSKDVIQRAKNELLEAKFLYQTVQGHRPNKASWYALTWRKLDKLDGFDPGASACFELGAYRKSVPIKNAVLTPPDRVKGASIGPSHGVGGRFSTPPDGPIRALFSARSTPPDGDPLEKPSPGVRWAVACPAR